MEFKKETKMMEILTRRLACEFTAHYLWRNKGMSLNLTRLKRIKKMEKCGIKNTPFYFFFNSPPPPPLHTHTPTHPHTHTRNAWRLVILSIKVALAIGKLLFSGHSSKALQWVPYAQGNIYYIKWAIRAFSFRGRWYVSTTLAIYHWRNCGYTCCRHDPNRNETKVVDEGQQPT